MKSFIQTILLSFLFSLMLTACSVAQESKTVKVVMSQKDSLYRFEETTTFEGDTVLVTNIRYFPEKWLTKAELQNYVFAVAAANEERIEELMRLRNQSQAEKNYYIALLDTIMGAGTYDKAVKSQLYQALQGAWSCIEKEPGKTDKVKTVTIATNQQGVTEVTTADGKKGVLEATGKKTFTLKKGTLFNFDLNFTYKPGNNTFQAERNGGKKFIFKR